jgi:hypothetical protein
VLEQRLTFERLCAISNVGEDQALPALDELLSGRLLLEAAQPDVASAYAFTNDMLRDVVYTEAGDARRRLFHQRAMEFLAAAGDSAAVLAHHALAAGSMQAAFHHSLDAGREALRLLAVSEAIVHFEQARQIVPGILSCQQGRIRICTCTGPFMNAVDRKLYYFSERDRFFSSHSSDGSVFLMRTWLLWIKT